MSVAEVYEPLPPSVLVVEDERKMRARLCEQIRRLGVEPLEAGTGFEAIRIAAEKRPQLIFLDGLLPQMHGFEVSRLIRRLDPLYRPRIVFMTAIYKSLRYHNEAKLKHGVDDYVIKPLADDVVQTAVSHAWR